MANTSNCKSQWTLKRFLHYGSVSAAEDEETTNYYNPNSASVAILMDEHYGTQARCNGFTSNCVGTALNGLYLNLLSSNAVCRYWPMACCVSQVVRTTEWPRDEHRRICYCKIIRYQKGSPTDQMFSIGGSHVCSDRDSCTMVRLAVLEYYYAPLHLYFNLYFKAMILESLFTNLT